MGFQNLMEAGYTPKGAGQGGFLEGILKGAEGFFPAYKEAQEKKEAKQQSKVSMYMSLRKAGYGKDQAYDLTLKGTKFPKPAGESDDLERQKTQAEIDKMKAETEWTKGGKGKSAGKSDMFLTEELKGKRASRKLAEARTKKLGDVKSGKPPITIKDALSILSDPLKAEYLKSNKPEYYKKLEQVVEELGGQDTEDILGNEEEDTILTQSTGSVKAGAGKGGKVKVIAPNGKHGFISEGKLQDALKRGFKLA